MGPPYTDVDTFFLLAALVPLGVAAAAWALQMSCGFCSIEPPEFWHAFITVVMIALANVVLRFVLHATNSATGMAPQYFMPAMVTAGVIALALPTTPFTALTITVVEVVMCVAIFFFVAWLQAIAVSSVLML